MPTLTSLRMAHCYAQNFSLAERMKATEDMYFYTEMKADDNPSFFVDNKKVMCYLI